MKYADGMSIVGTMGLKHLVSQRKHQVGRKKGVVKEKAGVRERSWKCLIFYIERFCRP